MAMPLHPGLTLLILNTAFRALDDDPNVEVAKISGRLLNLDERLHIAVIRRRVNDPKAPPQSKAIANDPSWRYQAIITARSEKPRRSGVCTKVQGTPSASSRSPSTRSGCHAWSANGSTPTTARSSYGCWPTVPISSSTSMPRTRPGRRSARASARGFWPGSSASTTRLADCSAPRAAGS